MRFAYRRWFLAAVIYNLAWGMSVVIYPRWFLIGYLACAVAGTLPWRFGVQSLMNDVVWFPAFWAFVLTNPDAVPPDADGSRAIR